MANKKAPKVAEGSSDFTSCATSWLPDERRWSDVLLKPVSRGLLWILFASHVDPPGSYGRSYVAPDLRAATKLVHLRLYDETENR